MSNFLLDSLTRLDCCCVTGLIYINILKLESLGANRKLPHYKPPPKLSLLASTSTPQKPSSERAKQQL